MHERRLQDSVQLDGPIKSNLQIIRENLALLETAKKMEMEGFRELVEGSQISVEELYERAKENCYLSAQEALEIGLVERVLS